MTLPLLKTAYRYDADGFFDGTTVWQLVDGEYAQAPDSTDLAPWGEAGKEDPNVFYRFVSGKWQTEPVPASADDLVGVIVSHTSMTTHDVKLRELVQKFGEEEGYRVVRGDDLSWKIEKIPEPTETEKEVKAAEEELAEFDRQIAALKERMGSAMLQGDDEQVEAIRQEYNNLMGA